MPYTSPQLGLLPGGITSNIVHTGKQAGLSLIYYLFHGALGAQWFWGFSVLREPAWREVHLHGCFEGAREVSGAILNHTTCWGLGALGM